MNNKNHLSYFLNAMKEELNFKDSEDFKSKVHLKNNLEFRIKIQKFVFLAKYFGWDNTYSYNMYHHGPCQSLLCLQGLPASQLLGEQNGGFALNPFESLLSKKGILHFKHHCTKRLECLP